MTNLDLSTIAQPKRPQPTPTQRAACLFIAALAENADQNRGILAENGMPETRCDVADLVKRRFFDGGTSV